MDYVPGAERCNLTIQGASARNAAGGGRFDAHRQQRKSIAHGRARHRRGNRGVNRRPGGAAAGIGVGAGSGVSSTSSANANANANATEKANETAIAVPVGSRQMGKRSVSYLKMVTDATPGDDASGGGGSGAAGAGARRRPAEGLTLQLSFDEDSGGGTQGATRVDTNRDNISMVPTGRANSLAVRRTRHNGLASPNLTARTPRSGNMRRREEAEVARVETDHDISNALKYDSIPARNRRRSSRDAVAVATPRLECRTPKGSIRRRFTQEEEDQAFEAFAEAEQRTCRAVVLGVFCAE